MIRTLTTFTGQTPNKATQTAEQFADNVYRTHLFYDNTFVTEMKGVIDDANTDMSAVDAKLLTLDETMLIAQSLSNYQGDWVAGTYGAGVSVSYLGLRYASKISNNTSTPPSADWLPLDSGFSGNFNDLTNKPNLDAITDVVITTPTTNDSLIFNGTNWVNSPVIGDINLALDTINGQVI